MRVTADCVVDELRRTLPRVCIKMDCTIQIAHEPVGFQLRQAQLGVEPHTPAAVVFERVLVDGGDAVLRSINAYRAFAAVVVCEHVLGDGRRAPLAGVDVQNAGIPKGIVVFEHLAPDDDATPDAVHIERNAVSPDWSRPRPKPSGAVLPS